MHRHADGHVGARAYFSKPSALHASFGAPVLANVDVDDSGNAGHVFDLDRPDRYLDPAIEPAGAGP